MLNYELIADESDSGERIDKWLSSQTEVELSRSYAARLIESGCVSVGGSAVSKSYRLSGSELVRLSIPDPVDSSVLPEDIPLDIVYEDDSLLVVNKPQGMVVHPAPGNYSGTLVNALLFRYRDGLSGINGVIRPGIVHRIDKNTSGLLVVAKTDKAHAFLAEQIKAHSFTREYEAICIGNLEPPSGRIDLPIGRDKRDRKRMCVTYSNSRNAVTNYETIERLIGVSHIRLRLETGRTHQIRVHCSHMGHPILGDDVYGRPYKGCVGQCLHAIRLGFIHPDTGEYLELTSRLPGYFTKLLTGFRQHGLQ